MTKRISRKEQIWEDTEKHDGRPWHYQVVRVNPKSVRVEPVDTKTFKPVGRKWQYRIDREEFKGNRHTFHSDSEEQK